MTRRCVISLATRNARFPEGLRRLQESLEATGYSGSVLVWPPSAYPAGCPAHLEVPFAFKPACFVEAQRLGFERILWMDAACVAVRPLDPLFAAIESDGYLLFRNEPYILGEWASDLALEALGLTREEALRVPEVNAAVIGLDLGHPVGAEFLRRWSGLARDGVSFRGVPHPLRDRAEYEAVKWNHGGQLSADPRVRGHRHDQTVAGALAHTLGMRLAEQGLRTYSRRRRAIDSATVVVLDRSAKTRDRPLVGLDRIRWDRDHPRLARSRGLLEHGLVESPRRARRALPQRARRRLARWRGAG